jgi:predicted Na+-dependent transporter
VIGALGLLAGCAVALVVFSEGLAISPGQVAAYFRKRPGTMARSLAAALVFVPGAALALILLLEPAPAVGIGLAILVSCPPAPLMISAAPKKGASAAFMASLRLSLAALAFATVPVSLYLLSIPLGFTADVDLGSMGWILARTLVLPIGLGLLVRHARPDVADRIGPAIGRAGSYGVLIAVLVALVAFIPALRDTDARSYMVIAVVAGAALLIGHLSGPAEASERTALAVDCGVRHPALALSIGSATFGAQQALPVLVPSVITFILMATAYLAWRRRSLA